MPIKLSVVSCHYNSLLSRQLWFTQQIIIYSYIPTYLANYDLVKYNLYFWRDFTYSCSLSLFHQCKYRDCFISRILSSVIWSSPHVIPFFKSISRISFLNTRSQTNAKNVTNTLDRFEILPRPSFRTSLWFS